jgi:hypothetical protein
VDLRLSDDQDERLRQRCLELAADFAARSYEPRLDPEAVLPPFKPNWIGRAYATPRPRRDDPLTGAA